MKGYLANGLFSWGDQMVNAEIAACLRGKYWMEKGEVLDLFVPQEQEINDKSTYADSLQIAQLDAEALMSSDFLVAVIDGIEIDSGVAAEIGMFSTTNKPIFALYTDVRQQGRDNDKKIEALINDGTENQFMYRNLFVTGVIKKNGAIYQNIDDLVEDFGAYIKEEMK